MSGQKEYFYAHRQEIDTIYNKKNNYLQNTESNPFFDIFSLEKKKKKKKKKKKERKKETPNHRPPQTLPLLHAGKFSDFARYL
jgi:hypothetical protein